MVAKRTTQYNTVEVRLKTTYSSHPKNPSQPVGSWAAATFADAVFMASVSGWAAEGSHGAASDEATLLATCAAFDKSDAMAASVVASYGPALCEGGTEEAG